MATMFGYSWAGLADTLYGGVNFALPGNGGQECYDFLPPVARLIETVVAVGISLLYFVWGYSQVTVPRTSTYIRKDRAGRRILLVIMSLMFGAEIGFKLATRQLIYILNPCHVTTAFQIVLLTIPPSKYSTIIFRIHLNFMNGAVLALLFPVTNTRLLPFEAELYWIQHIMMLVVPYYLLRLGGVYTIEKLHDWTWSVMSLGFSMLYHFIVLQGISVTFMVNLNCMLCPAISDPFYGPWYRVAAFIHQSLFIPLCGKTFCVVARFFLTQFKPTAVKSHLWKDVTEEANQRSNLPRCASCHRLTDCCGNRRPAAPSPLAAAAAAPAPAPAPAAAGGGAGDGTHSKSD
ncbi:transmembrane protein 164-like isoform X2 [Amphibalanus amphitrite]|uniref:transmembrane protein 164-like isoform X2 n=1 Tax=Amphibalanus amphitrite TaxID=1232801 RepID=UPI001C9115FD|nr:transmembrane protein 164-like isoform X2 [Amphibalanus amphitrite]